MQGGSVIGEGDGTCMQGEASETFVFSPPSIHSGVSVISIVQNESPGSVSSRQVSSKVQCKNYIVNF